MLRVLIAEDSPTARALLTEILESDPGIRVVGAVADGHEAVRMALQLRPDLITMDVHMPGMDGLEATREIMATAPTPILIVSSNAPADAALSLTATEAGALMVINKPAGPNSEGYERQRDHLLQMVRAMAQVRVVRRWRSRSPVPAAVGARRPTTTISPKVVAIAASTGGPAAIREILQMVPPDFPVPIAIVQHIARGFTRGLVQWLNSGTGPRVMLATRGATMLPGHAYVAPDDQHLGIGRDLTLELSNAAPIGQFRPSATYLFRSVAAAVRSSAVGVILTGMGEDGVVGLRELHSAGAYVIAQDEASSVIYGMAREAVHAGAVSEILPLGEIAERLVNLAASKANA